MEGEGMLVKPQYLELHKQLWKRQKEAVRKASSEAEAEAKAALVKARKYALDIQDRPPYITDKATLYPHQLQVPNSLAARRSTWYSSAPFFWSDIGAISRSDP